MAKLACPLIKHVIEQKVIVENKRKGVFLYNHEDNFSNSDDFQADLSDEEEYYIITALGFAFMAACVLKE